jgi:hypothetical protein
MPAACTSQPSKPRAKRASILTAARKSRFAGQREKSQIRRSNSQRVIGEDKQPEKSRGAN